jgi:hypothetical protein
LTDQTTSALGVRITISLTGGTRTGYSTEISAAMAATFTATAFAHSITAVVALIADLIRSTRIAAVDTTAARTRIGSVTKQTIIAGIRIEGIVTRSIVAAIIGTNVVIMAIAVMLTGTAGDGDVIIKSMQPFF